MMGSAVLRGRVSVVGSLGTPVVNHVLCRSGNSVEAFVGDKYYIGKNDLVVMLALGKFSVSSHGETECYVLCKDAACWTTLGTPLKEIMR